MACDGGGEGRGGGVGVVDWGAHKAGSPQDDTQQREGIRKKGQKGLRGVPTGAPQHRGVPAGAPQHRGVPAGAPQHARTSVI